MKLNRGKNDLGFVVNHGGVLSLLQDGGRFGAFNLGLTNGGPADANAFTWANKLCGNPLNSTVIEVSLGGLQLTAQIDCIVAVTGATMPLTLNGEAKPLWQSFIVKAGDKLELGFSSQGVRCYVAVSGGFAITPSFGSTATVCRESVGGLCGNKLVANDILPFHESIKMSNSSKRIVRCLRDDTEQEQVLLKLPAALQPCYANDLLLRMVLSYQQQQFSTVIKRLFFSSEYQVSEHWDRMGYRLAGRSVKANIDGILSEGICYGAVQVPADGQPIVLLNDRQTIGGYPKLGAVISQDCAKLSQLRQGDNVCFEAISMAQADNLFHLNLSLFNRTKLITLS